MNSFKKISATISLVVAVSFVFAGPITASAAGPSYVNLGTAGNFAILAGTPDISNVPTSIITGNVGLSPATGAGIGLTQAEVTGTIYSVDAAGPSGRVTDPALLTIAKNDLTAAYTDAANRTPAVVVPTELGGTTRTAGVYTSSSTALQITAGAGPLVLDGQNDPTSVFIFQASSEVAGALTVGPGSTVSLINGASACNVFWRVYGATIDTTAVFKGNIMAYTSIAVANGANIEGRLLAQTGNVTLIADTVTVPDCTASDAARAAAAAAAAAAARLPATGTDATSTMNVYWIIATAVSVFAISTFVYITRKRKNNLV